MDINEDRHDVGRLRHMDEYNHPTRSGYYVVFEYNGKRHTSYYLAPNPLCYPADLDPSGWYKHKAVAEDPLITPADANKMRSLGIHYWRTA